MYQTFQIFCKFCPPNNLEMVELIDSKLGPGTDEDRSVWQNAELLAGFEAEPVRFRNWV
jgi:hypothetical protein